MKLALIPLFILGLAFRPEPAISADQQPPVAAAATATNTLAPQIELQEVAYNFGKASSGELIKHEFIFTNTGQATLLVTNVQPACHCTTAGAWTREVAPGKTGVIPLQLDTTSFSGPITRTVSAFCNDPKHPIFSMSISGTISRLIEINPPNAIFNIASDVETIAPIILHITNNSDQPITLSEPQSPNRAFSAEIKTIKPGKEFELMVKASSPIGSVNISGQIIIKTSSPKVPVLTASVFAMVHPAVMVVPNQIHLLPGPLAMPVTNMVTIQNTSTNISSLALSEAAVAPGVDVQIREDQPGKQFTLKVIFPAGYLAPGGGAELSVKSSHPQFQQIKVPIIQPAAPPVIAAPAPMALPPGARPSLPPPQASKGQ